FSVLQAQATLREVNAGFACKELKSICVVNQRLAGIIEDIARKNTNNIVSMLAKIGETSLVSVGDSYKERKSRLIGMQHGLSAEDVLSKSSREKFKQSKNTKSIS
ncbi:MAG: hypothetical protein EZS28_033895, partial [Streblomastix strix]